MVVQWFVAYTLDLEVLRLIPIILYLCGMAALIIVLAQNDQVLI